MTPPLLRQKISPEGINIFQTLAPYRSGTVDFYKKVPRPVVLINMMRHQFRGNCSLQDYYCQAQLQGASSFEQSSALILNITPTHPPPGIQNYSYRLARAYFGKSNDNQRIVQDQFGIAWQWLVTVNLESSIYHISTNIN